jgi:hypothetical protein
MLPNHNRHLALCDILLPFCDTQLIFGSCFGRGIKWQCCLGNKLQKKEDFFLRKFLKL